LDQVVGQIRNADPWPLAVGVLLASLTFLVRLVRWRLLLRSESGAPLEPWPLWHATAIGFMANNILPFRAGELVRVFAATRLSGARFTAAMSSVAMERIFDGLTLIGLLGAGLLASHLPSGVEVGGVALTHAAQVAGLLSLGALLAAGTIVAFPVAAESVVRWVLPPGRSSTGSSTCSRVSGMALRRCDRPPSSAAWCSGLWSTG
jgi:uncharacterized membrane protein YbhN (UPF0104 family)